MFEARFATLALAIALTAAPTPVRVGAPLICFPIDIGDAASLPFGREGLQVKTAMGPDEVAATVRTVLDKSDDVMVHMETLRRTAIWLMSMESQADVQRRNAAKVQTLLTDRLLAAAATNGGANRDRSGQERSEALRWFDLGYFLATAVQARVCEPGASLAYLEKAARLLPDDRALSFGIALAECDHPRDTGASSWATHLARLFEDSATTATAPHPAAPAPLPANLKKNVLATFGAFLGQDDWDKLGAEVRKHVGRI